MDGRIGAVGQARIHGEGHVGRGGHLAEGDVEHVGQPLPPVLGVGGEPAPAALDHLAVGFLEARGGLDRPVLRPDAAFLVAHLVERREHSLAEPPRLLQHLLDHVRGGVGEAGQVRVGVEPQDLVQHEGLVTHRGAVGHGRLLLSELKLAGSGPRREALRNRLGPADAASPAHFLSMISYQNGSSDA